jgi:glycosyltransferase involved in cell wall biosynthesis
MEPLISILIPAFNAEQWIAQTIQSALGQTWPRKEVIVVDDGSSDQTLAIAHQFGSKTVSISTQTNQGAAAARNKAFSISQGEFIQWLDADDLLAPDKITLQLADEESRVEETLHSCAYSTFYHYPDRAQAVSHSLGRDLNARDWLVTALKTGDWFPPHAWLVSRRLTQRAGPWSERLSLNDDGEYFCRVVSVSERVKFHSQARCFYRIGNPRSLSHVRSQKALHSLLLSVNLSLDHLFKLDQTPQAREAALAFLQYNSNLLQDKDSQVWGGFLERAKELGGVVRPPTETGRFRVIRALLGEHYAVRIKEGVSRAKWATLREWERILSSATNAYPIDARDNE